MLRFAAANAIIQPIDNHNGLFVLSEAKKAHYQIDTYHLAVVCNTTRLSETYLELISNYFTIKLNKNKTIRNSIITKQIDYLIYTIENKLSYIGLDINRFRY